jgi:hypothetical protein
MTLENLICFFLGGLTLWLCQAAAYRLQRICRRRAARRLNHRCGTILHRA